MNVKREDIKEKGFIDERIDPGIDIYEEVNRMRKEKNAVILAHYYQELYPLHPCSLLVFQL